MSFCCRACNFGVAPAPCEFFELTFLASETWLHMLPECRGQRILASHVGIIFWRQLLLAARFGLGFRRWIFLAAEFWSRILALEILGSNFFGV